MIFRIARTLRMLALGLWVGAMTGFAFVVAPTILRTLGPTPQFAATIAGIIVATTVFGYACGSIAFITTALLFRSRARTSSVILILVTLMLLGSWYEVHAIVPLMERTTLHTPDYDALHHRSSMLYSGVLLAGVIAWVTGSWRDG